jgi:hypothetical protein
MKDFLSFVFVVVVVLGSDAKTLCIANGAAPYRLGDDQMTIKVSPQESGWNSRLNIIMVRQLVGM